MGSKFINLQNVYKKVLFSGLSNMFELTIYDSIGVWNLYTSYFYKYIKWKFIQNISLKVIQNYILNFHNHHFSSRYSYQIDQLMFVASSNISLTNHTQKTYYLNCL